MSNESVLPVGSVVKIESLDALVMVIGYEPSMEDMMAEYLGVIYPMGLISDQSAVAFDGSTIEEVVFTGYLDEEGERGFAAVRQYHDAARDMQQQVENLVNSLTPARVKELRDRYAPVDMPDEFEAPEGFEDISIE